MRRVRPLLCAVEEAPHVVLGVPRTATKETIKARFMELAKKHHPDAPGGSVQEFQKVRTAFETMIDGLGRKDFDTSGEWYEAKMGTAHAKRKPYAEWAEPNVNQKEAFDRWRREQETMGRNMMLFRFFLTFCFGSVMAVSITFDRDDEGLSWMEKQHPALLASRAKPSWPVADKKLLEARINKAIKEMDENMKFGKREGTKIPVPGIGYIDYELGRVVRSQTYRDELVQADAPKPMARWKVAAPAPVNSQAHLQGTPPVRPAAAAATPSNTMTTQRHMERQIDAMERELEALKQRHQVGATKVAEEQAAARQVADAEVATLQQPSDAAPPPPPPHEAVVPASQPPPSPPPPAQKSPF